VDHIIGKQSPGYRPQALTGQKPKTGPAGDQGLMFWPTPAMRRDVLMRPRLTLPTGLVERQSEVRKDGKP